MRTITWLRPGITESLAALVAVTAILAGCVSAGTQASGPGEAASLVGYRAAERDSEAAPAAGSEVASLVVFRAGERADRVASPAGGNFHGQGRFAR